MTANDDRPGILLEEAMDWLLRLQDAPSDPVIASAFDSWLRASADHQKAWGLAVKTWRLMGQVPPAYEHIWGETDDDARTPQIRARKPWRSVAVFTLAAAACVVAFLAYPAILMRLQADYVTANAATRTITLSDGSTVDLGANSALKADISESRRHVTLLAGEAFFDVTHDPSRPFVVDAGGMEVSVVGTAFNVRMSSSDMSVELARGAVSVFYDQPGSPADMRLAPGEMVEVDRASGGMVKSHIAPEDIAAWRGGRLFVNDATIGSVVEQIQRYHPAWISIPDGALAEHRVTGLYDLRDPDRALRALVQPYGGTVREISPYVRVLSRY